MKKRDESLRGQMAVEIQVRYQLLKSNYIFQQIHSFAPETHGHLRRKVGSVLRQVRPNFFFALHQPVHMQFRDFGD